MLVELMTKISDPFPTYIYDMDLWMFENKKKRSKQSVYPSTIDAYACMMKVLVGQWWDMSNKLENEYLIMKE